MPRINLLPWRQELLKEQRKEFGIAAVITASVAAVILFGSIQVVDGIIGHQKNRNAFLQAEIRILDQRIAEIRELEAQRNTLLARMNVIDRLQSSRPEIVHLFDELVQTLPDGVYLTSIEQRGTALELKGVAQSSARVSAYMRAIEASPYLSIGRLDIIQRVQRQTDRVQEFTLRATQVSPQAQQQGAAR